MRQAFKQSIDHMMRVQADGSPGSHPDDGWELE